MIDPRILFNQPFSTSFEGSQQLQYTSDQSNNYVKSTLQSTYNTDNSQDVEVYATNKELRGFTTTRLLHNERSKVQHDDNRFVGTNAEEYSLRSFIVDLGHNRNSETRALLNWQNHYTKWNKAESDLSKKLQREPNDLIMTHTHAYRSLVEDRELIDKATKSVKGREDNVIKGHQIGHDLYGLHYLLPQTRPCDLEHIIARENHPNQRLISPYLLQRRRESQRVLATLDPIMSRNNMSTLGDSNTPMSGLEVVGSSLGATQKKSGSQQLTLNTPPMNSISESLISGRHSKVILSHKYIAFHTMTDQLSSSAFTLYNLTNRVFHFEWVQSIPDLSIPVPVVNTYNCQVFFLPVKKGVLMPHSSVDFPVVFKSAKIGIYSQRFKLVTRPTTHDSASLQIRFYGECKEHDQFKIRRQEWNQTILNQTAMLVARDLVDSIFKNLWVSVDNQNRCIETNQHLFDTRNKQFMVQWNPKLEKSLSTIYGDVAKEALELKNNTNWDMRIQTLFDMAEFVLDPIARESVYQKLNSTLASNEFGSAKNDAVESLYRSQALYITCRDYWVQVLESIGDKVLMIRQSFPDLPMDRPCTRKFTACDAVENSCVVVPVSAVNPKLSTDKRSGVVSDKKQTKDIIKNGVTMGSQAIPTAQVSKASNPNIKATTTAPSSIPSSAISRPVIVTPAHGTDSGISAQTWSTTRKASEDQYLASMTTMVHEEICAFVDILCDLFEASA